MKRYIRYILNLVLVVSLFSINAVASTTIIDIIPEDSQIQFDENELDITSPAGLQNKISFETFLKLITESVSNYFPHFIKILASNLAFVLFFTILDHFSFQKTETNYRFIISCLASAVLTLFLLNQFSHICKILEKNLTTIRVFCDACIPIITALMFQGGKNFLSAFFSYSISLCGSLINVLNNQIFMPLIKIFLALGCCGCIWDDINFLPVTDMIQKFIKWLIGIVFSVFTFVLSIQNVLSRTADTTTQKILKNAAGSIPFMGSALSKGLDGIFTLSSGTETVTSVIGISVIISVFVGPAIMITMQSAAMYISFSVAKLFGQKDCISILKTVYQAYLLLLGLFIISVIMCIVCFLVTLGAK